MPFKGYQQKFPASDQYMNSPLRIMPTQAFEMSEVPSVGKEDVIKEVELHNQLYDAFWFFWDVNMGANQTVVQTKNVFNNAYFAWHYIVLEPTYDQTVMNVFEMQVYDAGKTKSFMDSPIRSSLFNGTAGLPFWLPNQIIFNPNSSIQITCTDVSGNANHVYMIFGGRRYYK